MAYPIPIESVASITIRGFQAGQTVMNVFHYKLTAATPPVTDGRAELQDLALALASVGNLYSSIRTCLSADVHDMQIDAQMVYPVRYRKTTFTPGQRDGAIDETALPPNVAQVVTLFGDLALRGTQGNKHLAGVPIPEVADGKLTAVQVNRLALFGGIAELDVQTIPGRLWRPIIFHRKSPGVVTRVVDSSVNPNSRVMRRRTVGLGT